MKRLDIFLRFQYTQLVNKRANKPTFAIVKFEHVPYICLFRYKKRWMLKINQSCSIYSNTIMALHESELDASMKIRVRLDRLVAIDKRQVEHPGDMIGVV